MPISQTFGKHLEQLKGPEREVGEDVQKRTKVSPRVGFICQMSRQRLDYKKGACLMGAALRSHLVSQAPPVLSHP